MKILLVDDDAFLRDMYATKFTEAKYDVLVAKSGVEALEILQSDSSVDVVMLDMIMPSMTGVELLRNINESNISPKPKCIVLSNQSETSDVESAMKEGAVGYIIKAETIPSDVVSEVDKLIK